MRASDFDLILVPENPAAPGDHWLTRWGAKLSTAQIVEVDGPATPGAIVAAAAKASKPILLIGHSTGAVAIAQAAAELAGADVRGAFLVAPPNEAALQSLNSGTGTELPRARLPWPSVVIASRTDPLAPIEHSRSLAEDWGAEFVDAGESGRIDADSGHGPWPDGLLKLAGFMRGL